MATETPANRDDFVHESPFAKLLDMRVADPEDGTSTVVMPINPNHLQLAGRVQGGILVALADYSMFRAIRPLLKPGEGTTTIELKINFLAAAEKGELTATCEIISAGRDLMVGEMEIRDQNSKLIAQGLGTYMVLQPRN
ncbi:MAG: thioesterase [Dehalococcoidia bacterium]|nr:MAG: PaaI family thioesterase [SAR202 cluster bacterium]GIS94487.1 MAG: thioesterase [Dehalococcoidia bacterium]